MFSHSTSKDFKHLSYVNRERSLTILISPNPLDDVKLLAYVLDEIDGGETGAVLVSE